MEQLAAGTIVADKFRIERELGAGGMGTVYVAEQLSVGRRVALKIMRVPHGMAPAEAVLFERRFFLEASLCAKLSHPNIVVVFDYGEVGRDPVSGRMAYFIAMELIEGETLESLLERQGALGIAETVQLAADIAKGLKQAHARGLLHRDLKPANIMMFANDDGVRAKILDFGLVRGLDESDHPRATAGFAHVAGTPNYMSPEQIFAQPLAATSDLYALGVVLFEALTGKLPYSGNALVEIAIAQRNTRYAEVVRPSGAPIPSRLEDLVLKLLSLEPTNRPENADEVLLELRRVEAQLATSHAPQLTQVETQTRYRVVRVLERRASSIVYEARHVTFGRRVSLHVFAAQQSAASSLAAELSGLASLRHPAFPVILDAGLLPNTQEVFLVMDEIRGRPMRSVLRDGAMSEARAVQLTLQLLDAVHEAHTLGFSHGAINQDTVSVIGNAPNELLRISDLADRSAAARTESHHEAREQADLLAIIDLFQRMQTARNASLRPTALTRNVEEILRPNGDRTSVVPDALTLRSSLLRVLHGADSVNPSARLAQRPQVWILNEDPAIDRLALVALANAMKHEANVRIIDRSEREQMAQDLAEDDAPAVVVFGDLHIVLEDPLLARIGELTTTQRILVSKGLNPELMQRSINFCGVDRHLCLPVATEELRKAVVHAVARAGELEARVLRQSSSSRTPIPQGPFTPRQLGNSALAASNQ